MSWSRRRAFAFLAIFLFVIWLVGCSVAGVRSYSNYTQMAKQMPAVTIKAGRVLTTARQPYLIQNPSSNKVFAIIDTSGRYQQFATSDAHYLITSSGYKYKVVDYRAKKAVVRTFIFPATVNLVVTQALLAKQIKIMVLNTATQHFLTGLLSSIIFSTILAALYALVTRLGAAMIARPLPYGRAFNLALVALTPGMGVFLLLFMWDYLFSLLWLLVLVIQLAYLFMAARAQPLPEPEAPTAKPDDAQAPPTDTSQAS